MWVVGESSRESGDITDQGGKEVRFRTEGDSERGFLGFGRTGINPEEK